jgi:tetratricopeptide (TPR) repeat protein
MRSLAKIGALLLGFGIAVGAASLAHAQAMGRVTCTVTDTDGNALQGVTATVTTQDLATFKQVKTSDKRGKFTVAVADATLTYDVKLEKEGYVPLVDKLKAPAGGFTTKEFVMLKPGQEGAPAAAPTPSADGTNVAQPTGGDRAVTTYNEGVDAQSTGDLDLAEKRFREAAEMDPTLAAAFTGLAGVALQRQQYQQAASYAEQAIAIDPGDFRALHLRYEAYRQLGDAAKTTEAAEALKKAGGGEAAAKMMFNEGAEAYNSGNFAVAKSKFEQVVVLDPELLQAHVALASLYLRDRQYPAAQKEAEAALERDATNIKAMQILYDSARLAGDADTAKATLDKLVQADPEWAATGLFQHAVELYNHDQAAEAITVLEEVLKVRPDHARAHYILGLALFNSGDMAGAKQHLQRFLELAPDDPDAAVAKEMLGYVNKG